MNIKYNLIEENKLKNYKIFINTYLNQIINNDKLMNIIIDIITYSNLFNEDNNESIKYMFLGSLISSDNIVNLETAKMHLDYLNNLKKIANLLNISENDYKELIKFINNGIKIIKQDIKKFKK